ncbi:MAG: glycosyl hydrolase, partial [bacterium]
MTRIVCRWLSLILLLFPAMLPAQTDSTELPELGSYVFGALRARDIGPAVMGGRISAIDVVNENPTTIYVGAASGGIWKSTDGGVEFEPIFDKYPQSIGAIRIDQARPDTGWVGTGEPWVRNSVSVGAGVYRTTDGGRNWEFMGLENTERIGDIVIDPQDPATIYVAALGHLWNGNQDRGLYKTTDAGTTWEKILYVDENTGCTDIAIDPEEPEIIYAAFWEFRRQPWGFHSGGPGSALYKSIDAGATWSKLTKGLPTGELGRIAVAVAPSRPSVLYAVVEAEKTGFYRSQDLGETWERREGYDSNVESRPFYFSLLLVDPTDYNRVYKPATYMAATSDGGQTFSEPVSLSGVHPDLHALWINPNNSRHLILGTDGGIYESDNRGLSWRFINNLPVAQFYHVSCDNAEPYNVYGGLQDNGSWLGPSSSPGGIENRDWQNLGGGDGFHVFADPTDSTVVYWQYQGGNLFRKDLKTGENKDIEPLPGIGEPEYRWNWNSAMALSPTDPRRVYVGSQFLHRTADRGDTWVKLSGDLTTNDPKKQRQRQSGGLTIDNTTAENHCTIFTIGESPLDPTLIWVGTDDGNLQVTQNDGTSWSNVVGNIEGLPKNTWCSSVAASHHD